MSPKTSDCERTLCPARVVVKPFWPSNHDALNENDYIMVKYEGAQIVPVK